MVDHTRYKKIRTVYRIIREGHADPLIQDLISAFESEVLLACPTNYIKEWIEQEQLNPHVSTAKSSNVSSSTGNTGYKKFFPVLP